MRENSVRHLRSLFLSDFHLGTRGCQSDLLLDFLRWHDAEVIYLAGDIVDGWRLKKGWYWPQSHNDVAQELLRKARAGSRIVYIPGNHDEFLREYVGTHFGGIEVKRSCVHASASGKRYLVMHGDEFDAVVRHAKWLAHAGDRAYDLALSVSRILNAIRRTFGFSYWSLSAWAKLRVKGAVNFISAFEEALARAAEKAQTNGVICGHIHQAAIHDRFGTEYMNCGDWVESCTALAERHDGRFEIIRWRVRRSLPHDMKARPVRKLQRVA